MAFCKIIVVVDGDVDLQFSSDDMNSVNFVKHILETVDFEQDLLFSEGILDVLDHSAPESLYGSKLGIDATRRYPGEKPRKVSVNGIKIPESQIILRALNDICSRISGFKIPFEDVQKKVLLFNIIKDGSITVKKFALVFLEHPDLKAFSVFVAFDGEINLADGSLLFWKLFNNVDPKRDIFLEDGRIVVDATKKGTEDGHNRPWPDDIVMDPSVKERVRSRAGELGIGEFLS